MTSGRRRSLQGAVALARAAAVCFAFMTLLGFVMFLGTLRALTQLYVAVTVLLTIPQLVGHVSHPAVDRIAGG